MTSTLSMTSTMTSSSDSNHRLSSSSRAKLTPFSIDNILFSQQQKQQQQQQQRFSSSVSASLSSSSSLSSSISHSSSSSEPLSTPYPPPSYNPSSMLSSPPSSSLTPATLDPAPISLIRPARSGDILSPLSIPLQHSSIELSQAFDDFRTPASVSGRWPLNVEATTSPNLSLTTEAVPDNSCLSGSVQDIGSNAGSSPRKPENYCVQSNWISSAAETVVEMEKVSELEPAGGSRHVHIIPTRTLNDVRSLRSGLSVAGGVALTVGRGCQGGVRGLTGGCQNRVEDRPPVFCPHLLTRDDVMSHEFSSDRGNVIGLTLSQSILCY